MGCFPACFTPTSKRPKRLHSDQDFRSAECLQPIEPAKRENIGKIIKLIREPKDEVEEQVNCAAKKRVTFALNIKSYEETSAEEEVVCDLVEGGEEKKSGNEERVPKDVETLLDTIALSKVTFFTPNNRYQNCRKSTDECTDIGLEDVDFEEQEEEEEEDDDDDGSDADNKGVVLQEESSESLFSLSIYSRKRACDAENGEKEVNSPMPIQIFCKNARERGGFGHPVLNPIENIAQWKEVKVRPISPLVLKHQEKENTSLEQNVSKLVCPEPSLKPANRSSKPNSNEMKQEIGVDTSLSSWLVGSEVANKSNTSENHSAENSKSQKERELGGVSISLSPTGSRIHSPHKTPIIGTVGSYWVHTGQNMDSESSSSGKRISVKERKNSTPFEAGFGRALDTGVCQSLSSS